jgi:hypothetical protein
LVPKDFLREVDLYRLLHHHLLKGQTLKAVQILEVSEVHTDCWKDLVGPARLNSQIPLIRLEVWGPASYPMKILELFLS